MNYGESKDLHYKKNLSRSSEGSCGQSETLER